jgi:hypothetical protein
MHQHRGLGVEGAAANLGERQRLLDDGLGAGPVELLPGCGDELGEPAGLVGARWRAILMIASIPSPVVAAAT